MADIKAALGSSFSSFMPSKKKKDEKDTSPKRDNPVTLLKIIAKNFMSIHMMARDLNVARQNMQKLVKLEGGKPAKGADAFFLKAGEREKKLETEMAKGEKPEPVKEQPKKKGFLAKLMEQFKVGNIIKSFVKYFYIAGIVLIIWDLFKESFVEWAKNLYDTIAEKFNEFVGKIKEWFNETIQPIIDKVKEFIQPVIDAVKNVVDAISNWFKEKIDWFAQTFPETFAFIKNVIDKVMSVINLLKEKFDAAVEGVKKVGKGVKKFFGLGEKEEPPKPKTKEIKLDEKGRFVEVPPPVSEPVLVPEKTIPGPATTPPPPAPAPSPAPTPVASVPKEGEKPAAPTTAPTPTKKPSSPGFEAGKKVMLAAMDKEGIKNPDTRAQMIAQTAHESGKFRYTEELGKPAYFEKYNGRKDLGNTQPGDGPRFKGRGFLQTTGRVNYQQFKEAFGLDVISKPETLAEPQYAAESALFWFKKNSKNVERMSGGDWSNTKGVTKAVNGGYNGLAEREHYFEIFRKDPEITGISAGGSAPSGSQVASNSSSVAAGQREQQKPVTPIVVNAPTTNNKVVNKTQVAQAPANKDTAINLAARAV